jgi:hypothetical protein
MNIIGELNQDGSIKTEVEACAISGQKVLGEPSAMQRILDTPYFYRYLSDYEHLLTREKRAELEALAKGSKGASPVRRTALDKTTGEG